MYLRSLMRMLSGCAANVPSPKIDTLVRSIRESLVGQLRTGDRKPFDFHSARRLYVLLFNEVERVLERTSDLLVVASGTLDQLPLHLLITKPLPDRDLQTTSVAPYQNIGWFVQQYATTVLPAVTNLKSIRSQSRKRGELSYIAFGNPLLNGPDGPTSRLASLARSWESCADVPDTVSSVFASDRATPPLSLAEGLADTRELMAMYPLPETAAELCRVGDQISSASSQVILAQHATETRLRHLDKSGELARYRILHFATHAAVAGELGSSREPGLILSPPDNPTQHDDGYLSRSEILTLRLNADWVVMSACNTASPSGTAAEGFSGLAQAFLHAGARGLLASHWAVDSQATVALVTQTFRSLETQAKANQSKALRAGILHYLSKASGSTLHPFYWAPFVVVGTGN